MNHTPGARHWTRLTSGVALAAFVMVGCASRQAVDLDEQKRDYLAKDYEPTLHKWTREAKLLSVDEMDNVLTVTSTFESQDFRCAYNERYARDYRLSAAKKKQLLARSLDESKKYHQFYVALYAQRHDWAELHTDDPAWIIRLVDSKGTETDPVKLDHVRRPGALELTYYPYTNSFRTVYRISFPKSTKGGEPTIANDADWFALRFAGAQGSADVTWQLE